MRPPHIGCDEKRSRSLFGKEAGKLFLTELGAPMSRWRQFVTFVRCFFAVSLAIVCLAGCQSKGSSQSGGGGGTGPSQDEITSDIIAGLPAKISLNCTQKKDVMLGSLKSIRYVAGERTILNVIKLPSGPQNIVRIDGKLFWDFASKETKVDPSAGIPLNVLMENDPAHPDQWKFNGSGPWFDIMAFAMDRNYCQRFQ